VIAGFKSSVLDVRRVVQVVELPPPVRRAGRARRPDSRLGW